jgi:glycosyltransferase involved in cell wall biosynthesis
MLGREVRDRGIAVELGVFGEGDLGSSAERLSVMGAEVINRWLTEAEISVLLPRFHVMVLSHVEASQSGAAAAALGAGLPVIATPVGGIIEQITDGVQDYWPNGPMPGRWPMRPNSCRRTQPSTGARTS